jgi:superfamily II DNA helicase RecQ
MDTITLDDLSSILFLSMAHVTILRFVKLAHTLNHLQDLHYVVVDEAHLFLSNFIPIMKRLLPLWVVGCQLVTLIASLSPSQKINLKIMMSTTFIVIRTLTMRLLIGYVVDEVVDVDNEFIQQFIKWDCNVSCEIDRGIIYFLTQQSIEQMALIANNVARIKSIHLHAHLDENTKKMQSQSWLSGEARVLVATGVIGCGYNYPSIMLVIHHGSFRYFVVLHQESS